MRGFKSFAKHTEMTFGTDFNCVLGPNGSGKCIVGTEKVYLADGSLVGIGELVNRKIKENACQKIDDGIVAKGDSTEILCLDTKTLGIRKRKVKAYIRRTSPQKLVYIRTKTGRTITSTEYHPLFVFEGEHIKSVNAESLKEGTRIAVPRKIPNQKSGYFYGLIEEIKATDMLYVPFCGEYRDILLSLKHGEWKNLAKKLDIPLNVLEGLRNKQAINFAYLVRILKAAGLSDREIASKIRHIKGKTTSNLCKIPWKNSGGLARLLGYLIAEGRLTDSNQVWFTNSCEEIVEDFEGLVKEVFGIEPSVKEYKPNCFDVIAYSTPMQVILSKFGMSFKGTEDKKITNIFLKNSSEVEIAEFLNGLYCGDGYISPNSVEIVTKSKSLARGIELMLGRLGIIFNSKFVIKTAVNTGFSGIYKQITFYGVENFRKFSGKMTLVHPEKQDRLAGLLDRKPNPNQDLIESNILVKKVAKELGINVKRQKKMFPRADSYIYNQCTPSRYGINHLLKELFMPAAASKSMLGLVSLQKLSLISSSDIFWDEIVEIKTLDSKERWVYDLCVEKDHNFVAENVFIHNSNVLDSLCFVLGKSSAKSMRAEKSSNLIYNGGKAKKPAKEGEVSIYFDNSGKRFPTEDPEVKITRIVRQSGQSVYKINDKTRTRQEVLDILSLAKIDPDGYNIILQGDITKFVEMHPVERRQLIEEISGISIYEEKKQKALNQLAKVEERLKEAEIVLAERKTYLKELKKEHDQAQKFKDMGDKISQSKASLLKIQIDKKEKEKTALQSGLEAAKKELDKINEKIESLRKQNTEKKQEIENISKEIEEKGEIEQVTLNKEIERLKIDLTKKNSRIETLNNELQKIEKRRSDLNNSLKETKEKIETLKTEKAEREKEKSEAEKQKKELTDRISVFRDKNKMQEMADVEKKIEETDKKAEELQKEIHSLREEQHNLLRQKDLLEHQISTIDDQIRKVEEVEKEHKKEIEELKSKRGEFKKTTLELNKSLNEDSSLALQIDSKRKKLAIAREELAKLEARNTTIKESTKADIAIKKVLERKGRGVYGTISDLGEVDSRYSLALEIAAGPRIKSIVVEDERIAAEQIRYLKQNRLGVATFIPLNKIKPKAVSQEAKELAKAKGCHGSAIDLISFDLRFRKAFEYIFSNTLVVDNIDTARRLGIGKARMVSLDGDLAEISGVMHGGYRKKRPGLGFTEKKITEDLQRYEEEVAETENVLQALENRRKENEERITELRSEKANLEADIIKAEKTLHLEPTDLEISKAKKQELNSKSKETQKKIDEIAKRISEKNKVLANNRIEKQTLRNKTAQLRNPALLAELAAFEEKRNEINESLARLGGEVKNIDLQINTIYLKEQEKVHQILKQIEKEEDEFRTEIDYIEKERKQRQEELNKKEKTAKDFHARFRALFDKRSRISEDITKNDNTVSNKIDESRKVEIKQNTLTLKHAERASELAGLQQEFQQYEGVQLLTNRTEEQLKYEISRFEKMKNEIGTVNMRALEIYDNVEKEYGALLEKKEVLVNEKDDVLKMMEEIEDKKKDLFMKNFDAVNNNFKSIFSQLTTKGDATLELENKENPFEGGLGVKVRITGQRFMDIRSLSGGEKTLTALAFIFSIQEYEPASFYVLDEVDAALDKRNSEKLAKLVAKYAEKAQYIIISHNDGIISTASTLYGVSMDENGISKVVSLKV
ncbi:chromosome segregation protein SMC [Candidatus Woesearchaeota archaeon]|nr:chromosome segregation protein SMC [Candidatus Woesearchaeota archaeon]